MMYNELKYLCLLHATPFASFPYPLVSTINSNSSMFMWWSRPFWTSTWMFRYFRESSWRLLERFLVLHWRCDWRRHYTRWNWEVLLIRGTMMSWYRKWFKTEVSIIYIQGRHSFDCGLIIWVCLFHYWGTAMSWIISEYGFLSITLPKVPAFVDFVLWWDILVLMIKVECRRNVLDPAPVCCSMYSDGMWSLQVEAGAFMNKSRTKPSVAICRPNRMLYWHGEQFFSRGMASWLEN